MPTLFTKPIETITSSDVGDLLGWPESLTVEFKEALSTKDGRPDTWLSGGKVGEFARDKLLKEVVALANTSGGHLILGIEEDKGATPIAQSIKPIPRCADLAQRLSHMAQHIDPPVPLLLIQGVAVDGEAGVVVFRVPSSRSAPHRAPDKECYVRRGTDSVPVSMREIQDMSLAIGRRGEWVTKRQDQAHADFQAWMAKPLARFPTAVGVRVTAIPISGPLQLGRLYGQSDAFRSVSQFRVDIGTGPFNSNMPRNPEHIRAILRGVRYVVSEQDNPAFQELYSDGCASVCVQFSIRESGDPRLYVSWLLPCILNALRGAHFLRTKAQAPETEYAVDVEIDSRPRGSIALHVWGVGFDDQAGTITTPLNIPFVSFGPLSDINQLVGGLLTDLRDAAGSFSTEPFSFISISGL